jgi:glycosyltransferase involved in cell wall biosynthesis
MTVPRLCFVGPMLGRHRERAVAQDETLASLIRQAGYGVRVTSSVVNRAGRAASMAADLMRWRHDFDVAVVMVFSGRAFAYTDLATFVSRRLGKQVVVTLHGGNLPGFAQRHQVWVERVLGRAHAVVAPSAYLARSFARRGAPVRVIPNVLQVGAYPYQPRRRARPRLLWMRAFEDLYRPLLALEAFALVRECLPDATMTMAGPDRGLLATTRRAATGMGLGESVRFPGFLDREGKRHAFEANDVFLNTPRVDNVPVSLLEAAASGLAVVTADVGGLRDLVCHERDALVAAGRPGPLADAVARVVNEPELAARLSHGAHRLAARYDWSHVRKLWEELFGELRASAVPCT